MSKHFHFMSCSQNISRTLVSSTVVPHNLQHIKEDKPEDKTTYIQYGNESRCTQTIDNITINIKLTDKNGPTSVFASSFVCQAEICSRRRRRLCRNFYNTECTHFYIRNVLCSRNPFPIPYQLLYNLCSHQVTYSIIAFSNGTR